MTVNKEPILVIDYETTGLPDQNAQGISLGAVLVDRDTMEPIDEFYAECQFDETRFQWSDYAEGIHGLSQEHLASQPTMQEAAESLVAFLQQHYSGEHKILISAHNPGFDGQFLAQWLSEVETSLKVSHRTLDTFSLGFMEYGTEDSKELFTLMGIDRDSVHNALEDAQCCVAVLQHMRSRRTIDLTN